MTDITTLKTGPELIDEIIATPTMDTFLDRDPHSLPLSDEELAALVSIQRKDRLAFNIKQEASKAKKQGVEEPTGELA